MNKLLAIVGPTATGKTDLGLRLAKRLNGELLACDSRQVYKGLDIGTGKAASDQQVAEKGQGWWKIDGVKVWQYDLVDPKQRFTVKDYVDCARDVIFDIWQRGKLPIMVGGTGLYFKGVVEGIENLRVGEDWLLRGELEKLPVGKLQKKLTTLSPTSFEKLNNSDRNNPRRLIRQIEMNLVGSQVFDHQSNTGLQAKVLKIGLTLPRQLLNDRIDDRLEKRLNVGLIKEAERLHKQGLSYKRMDQLGLEYRYLSLYLQGKINHQQLSEQLRVKIHQYAKRQMVWFKKDGDIKWFDISVLGWEDEVVNQVNSWYDSPNDS